MEMKLEEAQVCRLCGQCESIFIDVFGEEGTKRFLGLKIHTKVNIVIDEKDPLPKAICVQCLGKLEFVCDFQEECLRTQQELRDRYNLPPLTDSIDEGDGLSHAVCMRCIGTLEFIDEFHENCHRTQQKLVATKKSKKCPRIRANSPSSASLDDAESDKENATPVLTPSRKRKRQSGTIEVANILKPLPLEPNKGLTISIKESDKVIAELSLNKKDPKTCLQPLKPATTPSTKAKCDSSTKIELSDAKSTKNSSRASLNSELSNRKTRSRANDRSLLKKSFTETKVLLESPKSKPVAVIVKLEKTEQPETSVKSNELVWIPKEFVKLPEAEKPKSLRTETPHDECPIAGDEAGKRVEKSPESSASRSTTIAAESKDISTTKVSRKSVIETTPPKPAEIKVTKTQLKGPTAISKKVAESPKPEAEDEEAEEAEEDEGEEEEDKKKFGKISDLITEEQKLAIEKFYTVDMSVVDEEVVGEKIVFLDKKTYGCKICNASYQRQDKCQVHIWGHLEMRPYRCTACDFATVTVSNIRCHIRKSHLKIKPYACELCQKRYVTAFLLEEHMNTHTGSRPYSCNHCNFTSASRQVLSYHNATHKPSKDITCDVCGKEFFSKGRMRAHMVIHSKDKAAHMCKLCSIYLCNSEALERHHANVHSQDYICNVCEKRCKSKKALNNHQNVHSAAKYKCNLCSNVYKSSHILKEHLLKHKGIRKYKCSVCQKDFAQQSHLAAHMAVHSEKRFFCPGCNRPFNRHDNMKMHTKRCEAFLANPELSSLLTVRRSRSKPADKTQRSMDLESGSASDEPQSPQTKQPQQVSSDLQKTIELFTVGGGSDEMDISEDLAMIIGNTVVIPCS